MTTVPMAASERAAHVASILNRSSFVPIIPLLALGGFLVWQITELVSTWEVVDHTDRVIAHAHRLESMIVDEQTGLRGYLLTGEDGFLEPYRRANRDLPGVAQTLAEMIDDNPAQLERLEDIVSAERRWETEYAHGVMERKSRGESPEFSLLREGNRQMDAVRVELSSFIDHEENLRRGRLTSSRDKTTSTLWIGCSLIGLVAIGLVIFIRMQLASVAHSYGEAVSTAQHRAQEVEQSERELSRAVEVYGAYIEQLARGELGGRVELVGEGVLRGLGKNLEGLGQSLSSMTLRMREAVAGLSTATAEILSTTQQQSAGASESAAAVTETVTTVDEVSQSAQQAAERAKTVADASQRSLDVSQGGREAIERSVEAMSKLREQVSSIAERILALSEQAQTVGQIITTVNELAEQSNLLALNASIEAARAGEHGRSFAVVAQEVRSLAEQSKTATAQVRSILGDIQKSTTAAVLVTEQGSKAAVAATETVREAGLRIEQLATTIEEASQAARVIVGAAQQQVLGINQISQAMHSINLATGQAVEGTKQTERAARDLSDLAARLRETASQFRV